MLSRSGVFVGPHGCLTLNECAISCANVGSYKILSALKITPSIADGTPGTVEIAVDPELEHYGILDVKVEDSVDPNDFIIKINPNDLAIIKTLI